MDSRYAPLSLTEHLIARTNALLKIATFVYKDKIHELQKLPVEKKTKFSMANGNEFSEYIAGLVKCRDSE